MSAYTFLGLYGKEMIKKIFQIIFSLIFLSQSVVASDGMSFDFEDEPFFITPGEYDGDGYWDGNCTGAGCGDWEGYDDYDDWGSDWHDDFSDSDADMDYYDKRDLDHNNDMNQDLWSDRAPEDRKSQDVFIRKIKIQIQDFNNGFGFQVTDSKFERYYRGDNGKSYEWNGEIFPGSGVDNTDIYTNSKGRAYVKSTDGAHLLALDGLKLCGAFNSCHRLGYKEDWWNYSMEPEFNSGEEAGWYDTYANFARKQLDTKKKIEAEFAKVSSESPVRLVLKEARSLQKDANREMGNHREEEAYALEQAAASLTATAIEIGLGITPVGWGLDVFRLISGKDPIRGTPISSGERLLSGIGVMMPGISGLAFAGVKIVARHPLTKKGLNQATKQVTELGKILGDLKAVRFKAGKNTSEVAIIGRNMKYVNEARERMQAAGVKTRVFKASEASSEQLRKNINENGGRLLAYDEIPSTLTYKENMLWVEKIIKDDISVIDIGNPARVKEASRFYDDEIKKIFGSF